MICKQCRAEGKRSTIQASPGATTCVHYSPHYDEDGEFHSHDGNRTTYSLRCSNGHSWTDSRTGSCPNPKCNWGKDA